MPNSGTSSSGFAGHPAEATSKFAYDWVPNDLADGSVDRAGVDANGHGD